MTNSLWKAVRVSLVCLAVALSTSAQAAFPEKPVRMVVPSAPGGALDTASRILADRSAIAFACGLPWNRALMRASNASAAAKASWLASSSDTARYTSGRAR